MGRTITQTPFAGWLDGQLTTRGLGVRTLARQVNPGSPEVARRALNRYLYEGATPTPAYVVAIAAALEVDADEIPVAPESDDEEEADPAMRRAFDLFIDLLGTLEAVRAPA